MGVVYFSIIPTFEPSRYYKCWIVCFYYKFEGKAPAYISRDLRECAEMVSALDEKMLSLNEAILECLRQQKNGREEERQEELEENQIQFGL